jgi:hypothetical protein
MTLSNDQMKAGRYLKLAKGRKLYRRMNDCWDRGVSDMTPVTLREMLS